MAVGQRLRLGGDGDVRLLLVISLMIWVTVLGLVVMQCWFEEV